MVSDQRAIWPGAGIISAVWMLGIVVLVIGTLTHSSIGFVWPMGQDIDWSLMLKQGPGSLAAGQEFAIDHRNPLSGWVYSLAAPLILGHQYGLHFLRLATCLMLGLSVYALAWQFCRGRALYFPILLGSIISIWWVWSGYTQVVWLMLFALALSVLTVWSYCVYVDSGRTKGAYYGWSLALWLVVLGTYSIQCGAFAAVFLIALFRGEWRGWMANIGTALRDVAPFLVVGAAFGMTWLAAANGFFSDSSIQQTTSLNISLNQLLQSLQYFLWHPIFTWLSSAVIRSWTPGAIVLTVCFVALIMYRIKTLIPNGAESARVGAGWMLATMTCLALPTLALESTSPIWGPGLRSDMMFAAFIPTIVLCSIVLLSPTRHVATMLFAGGATLTAAVVFLSLEQNMEGVAATRWQRNLAIGLTPYRLSTPEPLHFIVINKTGVSYVGDDFGARFVQDKLNRVPARWSVASVPTESSMRIVDKIEGTAAWPLSFEGDIVKGALYNSAEVVARGSTPVVTFDGESVSDGKSAPPPRLPNETRWLCGDKLSNTPCTQ